jgi:AcrR family transcriptional regulator
MGARAAEVATTRERIAGVMLRLALEQPFEQITLMQIAEAAGVSHQTVLNHFESKEGVAAAAADILARETREARAKARPGDQSGAIAILVGEYERIGDANVRWVMASQQLGALASRLDEARAAHQAWLERVFADRLPTATAPVARRRVLLALHAATDVYTWKLLRRDLRLSREETERIIGDLVEGTVVTHAPLQPFKPAKAPKSAKTSKPRSRRHGGAG